MGNFDLLSANWDNEPRRIERAQVVAKEIINNVPAMQTLTGLEYGCGTGLLSFNLQKYLNKIILADNSEGMLSVLKQKIQSNNITNMKPLKIDLSKDVLPEINCDIIYTLMTLHHIVNVDIVLKAFYSILNSSGYLCIADLDKEDGSFHGKDFIGHNGFDRIELLKKLKETGFSYVNDKICYEVVKNFAEGQEKRYPLFLIVVQKT